MKLLYIDGQQVDLYTQELIATSYAVNKIAEIKDIQSTFSNQFVVPATDNNNKIFGVTNNIGSTSEQPYKVLNAQYIQNGTDVLRQGAAILISNKGDYTIEVYAGLFDFFTQIGDRTLADLDFSSFDFILNAANVNAINNSGGPLSYPIVNFGQFDAGVGTEIDIRYLEPAFKVSYIMDKIFAATTWNKSGAIFTDPKYTNLNMLLTGDPVINSEEINHSRSFKFGTAGFNRGGNSVQYLKNFSLLGVGRFDVSNEASEYESTAGWVDKTNPNAWRFVAKSDCLFQITINIYNNYINGGTVGPYFATKNNIPPSSTSFTPIWSTTGTSAASGNVAITSPQIKLKPGESIYIWTYPASKENVAHFYRDGTQLDNPTDLAFIEFKVLNSSSVGSPVSFAGKIDEMKQVDFVRSICNLFGIVMQPNDETVEIDFKQFKDIRLENKTVDWSSKIDLTESPEVKFHPDGFYQNNWMRWIQDDTRGQVGDGVFPIADNTLPQKGDLFTLDFASSLQQLNILPGIVGVTIPRFLRTEADQYVNNKQYRTNDLVMYGGIVYIMINVNPQTGVTPGTNPAVWQVYFDQFTFDTSTEPHLIYTRNVSIPEGIKLTDNTNTPITISTMPLAWFTDQDQAYNLDFSWIISKEWYAIVDMLQQYKEVVVYLLLNELDIAEVDFFKMPFIEYFGERFYLNFIDGFIDGTQSTPCTLIRT